MQHIKDIYNKIALLLADPQKFTEVKNNLTSILSSVYTKAMTNDKGYCGVFIIPQDAYKRFVKLLEIDIAEMEQAFRADWQYPHSQVKMYSDPYYHVFFLLFIYGLNNPNTHFAEDSLTLILMRIWNGRKAEFFRYCNPDIMKYVVNHLVSKKFLVSKYDSPLSLIKDYFVPTILSKYGEKVKRDYSFTKHVFSQCWQRIRQIFISSPRYDVIQKRRIAQSGLLPLYMKAKEEGLYQKAVSNTEQEGEVNPLEDTFTSSVENIVNDTVNYIIMNPQMTYPDSFINMVNKNTNVSKSTIQQILRKIHDVKFNDEITDALNIILNKCNITHEKDLCFPSFLAVLRKNVLSSKNNRDIRNLRIILDKMLIQIFQDLGLDYNKYSNVHKIQIRNVIVYALYFNARRKFCS